MKLGANITVNRIAGSGAGGNLTASDRPFCGTFDGGGNTLTFNYGSSGTPADENNLAPFRYVNNATIQHLHVAGNIYTQHVHAGGIVGMAYGTTNITDCHSSVNIISSINGDGTHGGIMSCSWTGSTTNITGCLFDGSIQSAANYATDQCGGFVGWRNATINVKNCLLTADLSTIVDPEGLQYPSGTFVRNGVANTITNSYYTAALGTIQGKQVHSIKAGENVTVANAGTPEIYKTSGITSYGTGIMYDNVLYAGNGDNVSLTLGNTLPEGFDFNGYTTTGGTLTGTDNPYTLTMPDADVTISAEFELLPVSVTYIDENGEEQTANALPLLGGGATTLAAGWYVVNSDISYTGTVTLGGDVHLILADGNTMTVTPANAHGIDVDGHALTIYGQTNGTGTLTATASGWNAAICAANSILNIHGGTINAIYNGTEKNDAINIDCWTSAKGMTITGGKVTADGGDYGAGISIGGCHAQILGGQVTARGFYGICIWDNDPLPATLTLGCSKVTDFISIRNIYNYAGQEFEADVQIADGQTLYDGTNIYSGTLTSDQISVLAGKTLRLALLIADAADNTADIGNYNGKEFAAVQLSGRTLFKDGAWNTLCLPFSMNAAQVTAQLAPDALMTLSSSSFSDGTLTMTFTDADEITAGKPYIIKWSGDGSDNLVNPTFTGVTISNATASVETDYVDFIGTYDPTDIYTEEKTNLYLGDDNKLCYPNANLNINACRAYFQLAENLYNPDLGDVNGDGNINITDVIFMVNHILGQNNDDFIIANADMDQSGGIDIGDVVRLVNMILNPESSVKVTNVVSNVDITYDGSGSVSAR